LVGTCLYTMKIDHKNLNFRSLILDTPLVLKIPKTQIVTNYQIYIIKLKKIWNMITLMIAISSQNFKFKEVML